MSRNKIQKISKEENDWMNAPMGEPKTGFAKVITFRERKPKIVCLCGSTRFMEAFQKANLAETMAGNIVLSVGCNTKSDADLFSGMDKESAIALKHQLDELHKRKIDLADEILVLNVGKYIGESTHNEIRYAVELNKTVRFLEPIISERERINISEAAKTEPV
jgi:hypothetical protein